MSEVEAKNADKTEWLGCYPIGPVLHAAFPTALRTLCLVEKCAGEVWEVDPQRKEQVLLPTCHGCLRVIGAWNLYVESEQVSGIPKSWRQIRAPR